MRTRKKSVATERNGLNYVRDLFESANCIFHPIHQENDVGQDAFIDLVDGEVVTAKSIAVQIKSGTSYCQKHSCTIPASKGHFEFWSKHPLRTYGIVYDPTDGCAYWTNISARIKANPNLTRDGPYTISIPKTEITRLTKTGFSRVFLPLLLGKPLLLPKRDAVRWALASDFSMHELGLGTLLYRFRNDPAIWDIFLQIFSSRPVAETSPYLMYILALVPGHPDIFRHKQNQLTQEIRNHAAKQIRAFKRADIAKLLSFIDAENGLSRGSVGQDVEAVITMVENYRHHLSRIVQDDLLDDAIREFASIMLNVPAWQRY